MRVRFGPFVLDPSARELLRGRSRVPLSPKAFDLLILLAENRPKAMAKNELLERLWPSTFVVDKNLANLIGEIREALGDDATNARYIRTVQRFGYAFRDESAPTEADRPAARGAVSFVLKWVGGRATLREGRQVLGRDPDVDIFLNQPRVSRHHARITVASGRVTIEDIGSKNGTFVGSSRVDSARLLADGDVIALGAVELTLHVVKAPNSTETEFGAL
jgi:DNA-binding winged helix-turn-helix (wHTH) protein